MKEKIIELVDNKLEELSIWIDDVYEEEREGNKFLCVVLDSEEMLDLNKVTEASRIINSLIDEADMLDEAYILDIYAKSKGEN